MEDGRGECVRVLRKKGEYQMDCGDGVRGHILSLIKISASKNENIKNCIDLPLLWGYNQFVQ